MGKKNFVFYVIEAILEKIMSDVTMSFLFADCQICEHFIGISEKLKS